MIVFNIQKKNKQTKQQSATVYAYHVYYHNLITILRGKHMSKKKNIFGAGTTVN